LSQRDPNYTAGSQPAAVMQAAEPNAGPRFLDVPALAREFGFAETWIYGRTGPSSTDRIPHYKFGKYVRFDIQSEEFKAWLKRNFRT
jgi:hypothetical protein